MPLQFVLSTSSIEKLKKNNLFIGRIVMNTEITKENAPATKNLDVEIAGISLKLRTNHSKEVVDQLVSFVDNRCKRVMNTNRKTPVETAAILAALSIAEDLFTLKKEAKESLDQLSLESGKLLAHLEEASKQNI